jgi:DNA-binding CsgD family transcriptional regulator
VFYRQLAEISSYVHENDQGLNEIIQMLCLKSLSPLKADALMYSELDSNGFTIPQASFGIELRQINGELPAFHIAERTPFTDAIRENRIVVINTLPQWPKPYSALKKLGIPESVKSLITAPVEISGLPIGSLTTFSHARLELENELAEFVEAVAMILALAIKGQRKFPILRSISDGHDFDEVAITPKLHEIDKDLSERQLLILKLIAEGRTNASIADVLGYSESLIRQETIKIYAKLNCSGRNEAAQVFHRMEKEKEVATA